jgi:small subunit ribosomal protein S3e
MFQKSLSFFYFPYSNKHGINLKETQGNDTSRLLFLPTYPHPPSSPAQQPKQNPSTLPPKTFTTQIPNSFIPSIHPPNPSPRPTNTFIQFVADGVFFAELNEFLTRELAEEGYSGVEVRVTPARTEIIIRATRTQDILGEKGRRIRELTSVVQKRFGFAENSVELYAEKVANRGLCAIAQAESLKFKLLGGLAVRRYGCRDLFSERVMEF